MNRTKLFPMALAIIMILAFQATAQNDPCRAVLEQGIFNNTSITASTQSQRAFDNWLCTTEFSTYEELRKAGIGLGAVVYDIPVTVDWRSDAATRATFKSSHCQQSTGADQYAARYEEARSFVAPEVVRAWSECIRNVFGNTPGVKCVVSAPDAQNAIFSIRFIPLDEQDTVLPRVISSTVTGASPVDTDGLQPRQLIRNQTVIRQTFTTVSLQRVAVDTPISMVVNTSRGACSAFVPKPTVIFRTKVTIDPIGEMPITITENLHLDDGSDNCDINETRTARYDIRDGERIIGTGTPNVTSSNCPTGKSFPVSSSVRNEGSRRVAIDYHLEGCGRNGPFGLAGCAGRGWLVFDMPVNIEKFIPNTPLSVFSLDSGETTTTQTSNVINYPFSIPSGFRNINFRYTVEITRRLMLADLVLDEKVTRLSNVNPTGDGIETRMDNGRLGITITQSPTPFTNNRNRFTLSQ